MKEREADIVILGGGLSGLIVATAPKHRERSVLLVTRDYGGLALQPNVVPILIHSTDAVKRMLNELGVPFLERTARVGYFYEGAVHEDCPVELEQQYWLKSRGQLVGSQHCARGAGAHSGFRYLWLDTEQLVMKLREMHALNWHKCSETLIEEIVTISPGARLVVTSQSAIHYKQQLISTIAAPDFSRLAGKDCKFQWRSKQFFPAEIQWFLPHSRKWPFVLFDYRYQFIYFPEIELYPYLLRISRTDLISHRLVAECAYPPDMGAKQVVKYGYMLCPSSSCLPQWNRVVFLGRYAEWNDQIFIHDVVERTWG